MEMIQKRQAIQANLAVIWSSESYLSDYIISLYHELYENDELDDVEILFEGAQGFGLDVDWGDYPYVTSSHCTVGSAISR